MHSLVRANAYVALRLSSDNVKVLQILPNTTVSLGKYGTFPSNFILDRPYNLTYELLDRESGQKDSSLRIVPASELHADTIAEEEAALNTPQNEIAIGDPSTEFQLVSETGEVLMRTNRETIDDSARQTLTMTEIETLKREGTGAGKEIIAKLMASHLGIEQKTVFSLAKYKLLKTKKYLRRFTILPVDVRMLGDWLITEKDSAKIMEFREEMLSLAVSWSNVHFSESLPSAPELGGGRWLVVDETGGLLVAALAERMGILFPDEEEAEEKAEDQAYEIPMATSNTLTVLHTNAQPNLSLLTYFNYSTTSPNASPNHPLSTNLHSLSWLQLLSPERDMTYSSVVEAINATSLASMKSAKRGTYYRKLRRNIRVKKIVQNTKAGGFDGLAVASHMDPVSILRHTVPLLRGGAPISIYSPTIEPLMAVADIFSMSRRTAFITAPPVSFQELSEEEKPYWPGDEDFPLNPTMLLNTNVQTARVREWQVLPGRTHPIMTGRGGAEGYLFTAVRVVPAEGKVEARGKFVKKRVADGPLLNGNAKAVKVEAGILVGDDPMLVKEDGLRGVSITNVPKSVVE